MCVVCYKDKQCRHSKLVRTLFHAYSVVRVQTIGGCVFARSLVEHVSLCSPFVSLVVIVRRVALGFRGVSGYVVSRVFGVFTVLKILLSLLQRAQMVIAVEQLFK